jgi:hypothetical protein
MKDKPKVMVNMNTTEVITTFITCKGWKLMELVKNREKTKDFVIKRPMQNIKAY